MRSQPREKQAGRSRVVHPPKVDGLSKDDVIIAYVYTLLSMNQLLTRISRVMGPSGAGKTTVSHLCLTVSSTKLN